MLSTDGITLQFGKRILFEDVSVKFAPGNCYGLIGANGSGKSTFLKILSGDVEQTRGNVSKGADERMAMLRQDQFQFDEIDVISTVVMGHQRLFEVMSARDELYAKADFSEADGIKAGELEEELSHLNGYDAPVEAAILLGGLGIEKNLHDKKMKELDGSQKVRVLLAQALFGNPDILLLDEPTNNLDPLTVEWLEDFLADFKNTVIVVSHDRHFLDRVCTHIADIDYGKITLFTGNYSFWKESSQLALQQKAEHNKKTEARAEELKTFIARFSANASKSRQATSRKMQLEKLTLEDIKPSSRRYPYILFKPAREAGDMVLQVENLSLTLDGVTMFKNVSFLMKKEHKIAVLGRNRLAITAFFQVLMGEIPPDSGEITWGQTITKAYLPKDNTSFFNNELNLIDWLRQYSEEKSESFIRSYLGRMLFGGEEPLKMSNVISGGEKVRCMLSRMMLTNSNFLILDEPTAHLDLESISALNDGVVDFAGNVLFTSHDHQFMTTIANRVIELGPKSILDREMSFDEFLHDDNLKVLRKELWK